MTAESSEKQPDLRERAYAAFDDSKLGQARELFEALLAIEPDDPNLHYMAGLACKYLRDWPACLAHNLRSLALRSELDEASVWNAGIAATALADHDQARRLWQQVGIKLPGEHGPVEGNFGHCSIRLNAWDEGETLFAQRIDVVRAKLLNVPLPESGYRCGDIVLHDGASTGRRRWGSSEVFVFNALQRLQQSEFATYAAFCICPEAADAEALAQAEHAEVAEVEDWTDSLRQYCLRCSYGAPHAHRDESSESNWRTQRSFGIAARSRAAAESLLERWCAAGRGREVESLEQRDYPFPELQDGIGWWASPDDG